MRQQSEVEPFAEWTHAVVNPLLWILSRPEPEGPV